MQFLHRDLSLITGISDVIAESDSQILAADIKRQFPAANVYYALLYRHLLDGQLHDHLNWICGDGAAELRGREICASLRVDEDVDIRADQREGSDIECSLMSEMMRSPTRMESALTSGCSEAGSVPWRTNWRTSAVSVFQSKWKVPISARPPLARSTSSTRRCRTFLSSQSLGRITSTARLTIPSNAVRAPRIFSAVWRRRFLIVRKPHADNGSVFACGIAPAIGREHGRHGLMRSGSQRHLCFLR